MQSDMRQNPRYKGSQLGYEAVVACLGEAGTGLRDRMNSASVLPIFLTQPTRPQATFFHPRSVLTLQIVLKRKWL